MLSGESLKSVVNAKLIFNSLRKFVFVLFCKMLFPLRSDSIELNPIRLSTVLRGKSRRNPISLASSLFTCACRFHWSPCVYVTITEVNGSSVVSLTWMWSKHSVLKDKPKAVKYKPPQLDCLTLEPFRHKELISIGLNHELNRL